MTDMRPRSFFRSARSGEAEAPRPGFTLVEVLVSVVVLTIGLVASLYIQVLTIKNGAQADNLTVASLLAESEIERLRAVPEFNNVPAAVNTGLEHLTREGESCAAGSARCVFTRQTTLRPRRPTTRSHTIEVTVNWVDSLGARDLTYSAILTDFNLGNSL
jgi:type IV pilus modification protein PilV